MGFSNCFYTLKKYKDYSVEDCINAYEYAAFKKMLEGEWFQKQMAEGKTFTVDDYGYECLKGVDVESIDKEMVDFYYNIIKARKDFDEDYIDYWGSYGSSFHDFVMEHAVKNIKDMFYVIDKDSAYAILDYANKWLDEHRLEPVDVKYAFKENEDETITLIPCDGIEAVFEDGTSTRLYSSDEYGESDVYAAKGFADNDKRYTYESLRNTMIKTIQILDKGDEFALYQGGW